MTRPWPEHWPEHRNPTTICDMLDGPCACGAWHKPEEFDDYINEHGLSMKIELEFTLGKLYSVPYADGMAHGILREVKIEGDDLTFKIQRPVGTIEVTQTLPRRRKDVV